MKFALLVGAGIAYGLLGWFLFRGVRGGQSVNRILAHVLSFRLFLDEPGLIFRAQIDLLRENLRLLRRIAFPCAVLGAVFALSFHSLDGYFGHGALPVGQTTVISASKEAPLPAGLVAETPAVRIPRLHQVLWRVHPTREFAGRFPAGVEVHYPRANILGLPWLVWFGIVSAGAAMGISLRGVTADGPATASR
ncbi:MAG: hypothetical protein ABUS49_13055 [Acidobacteriota bacterium]